MSTEKDLLDLIAAVMTTVGIQGKVAIRRRTTPSRGRKGLEAVAMVEVGVLNETLFNRFRDAMMDDPSVTNVESVNEVEQKAEIDFFVIEAEFDYKKGM